METRTNDTVNRAGGEQNDSRRNFMKKGVLTAGALALGLSATGTATAQDGQDEVLVFTDDYIARTPFHVIAQLPQSITIRLLRLPNGNEVPEISQPDDYNGYSIRYGNGGNVIGASYVFTQGTLREGRRFRFSSDANIFSGRLNLVSATVNRANGN